MSSKEILVIRHGLSAANDRNNPAFGSPDAELLPKGLAQAAGLGALMVANGVDACEAVAVSELRRTQQTAHIAGFTNQTVYEQLNEADHKVGEMSDLRRMLDNGQLPRAALFHARSLLENPPPEDIWFTHGLVIAGLCHVLDVYQDRRLIPKFCEVRNINV